MLQVNVTHDEKSALVLTWRHQDSAALVAEFRLHPFAHLQHTIVSATASSLMLTISPMRTERSAMDPCHETRILLHNKLMQLMNKFEPEVKDFDDISGIKAWTQWRRETPAPPFQPLLIKQVQARTLSEVPETKHVVWENIDNGEVLSELTLHQNWPHMCWPIQHLQLILRFGGFGSERKLTAQELKERTAGEDMQIALGDALLHYSDALTRLDV